MLLCGFSPSSPSGEDILHEAIGMVDLKVELGAVFLGQQALSGKVAINEELSEGDQAYVNPIVDHGVLSFVTGEHWLEVELA